MLTPLFPPPLKKGAHILVACEESGVVTAAFRKGGHNSLSCDLEPTRGNKDWHIQADVLDVIRKREWDCVIAFPPCTHLCGSGTRWFEEKRKDGRQEAGIAFFMSFVEWQRERPSRKLCIENPVGIMGSIYRPADQIIQPYEYGEDASKSTCLWLFNLPLLRWTKIVPASKNVGRFPRWGNQAPSGAFKTNDSRERSVTFPGIAAAMAEQWGG